MSLQEHITQLWQSSDWFWRPKQTLVRALLAFLSDRLQFLSLRSLKSLALNQILTLIIQLSLKSHRQQKYFIAAEQVGWRDPFTLLKSCLPNPLYSWLDARAKITSQATPKMPIFIRRDKWLCGCYRHISFLRVVKKVLATVILDRLTKIVLEGIDPEGQCCFRRNQGTVGMIFIIMGKLQENDLYTHTYSPSDMDFDSIDREGLWHILPKLECPSKTLRMIVRISWCLIRLQVMTRTPPPVLCYQWRQARLCLRTIFSVLFCFMLSAALPCPREQYLSITATAIVAQFPCPTPRAVRPHRWFRSKFDSPPVSTFLIVGIFFLRLLHSRKEVRVWCWGTMQERGVNDYTSLKSQYKRGRDHLCQSVSENS